jgi:hypothetical protein
MMAGSGRPIALDLDIRRLDHSAPSIDLLVKGGLANRPGFARTRWATHSTY